MDTNGGGGCKQSRASNGRSSSRSSPSSSSSSSPSSATDGSGPSSMSSSGSWSGCSSAGSMSAGQSAHNSNPNNTNGGAGNQGGAGQGGCAGGSISGGTANENGSGTGTLSCLNSNGGEQTSSSAVAAARAAHAAQAAVAPAKAGAGAGSNSAKAQVTNNSSSSSSSNNNNSSSSSGSSSSGQGGPGSNSSSHSSSSSSSASSSSSGGSSSSSNVTAFLSKLWRLVNDLSSNDLICWSNSGTSFVITNQIQFAKDLLPLYFKHSNMASFIRQLNMYGFRKIPTACVNGSPPDKRTVDVAHFYHADFVRGHERRLACIKRKNNSSKTSNLIVNGTFCDEVRAILSDVRSVRDGQLSSESILGAMQVDNKSLWRDVAVLRSQHQKQRRVIEKLIQFLLSLRNNMVSRRRKAHPMIHESDHSAGSNGSSDGHNGSNGASAAVAAAAAINGIGHILHEQQQQQTNGTSLASGATHSNGLDGLLQLQQSRCQQQQDQMPQLMATSTAPSLNDSTNGMSSSECALTAAGLLAMSPIRAQQHQQHQHQHQQQPQQQHHHNHNQRQRQRMQQQQQQQQQQHQHIVRLNSISSASGMSSPQLAADQYMQSLCQVAPQQLQMADGGGSIDGDEMLIQQQQASAELAHMETTLNGLREDSAEHQYLNLENLHGGDQQFVGNGLHQQHHQQHQQQQDHQNYLPLRVLIQTSQHPHHQQQQLQHQQQRNDTTIWNGNNGSCASNGYHQHQHQHQHQPQQHQHQQQQHHVIQQSFANGISSNNNNNNNNSSNNNSRRQEFI